MAHHAQTQFPHDAKMMKEHPAGGKLDASFLAATMKSSDAKVVHRMAHDVWSVLLSREERAKLVHGTIDPHCLIFSGSWCDGGALRGSDGWLAFIDLIKVSIPNATCNVYNMGESVEGDATFVFTRFIITGTHSGAPLWGVSATNKHFVLHGITMYEVKGALITKMHPVLDIMALSESGFPVQSSTLLQHGAAITGASIAASLAEMAHKAMQTLGLAGSSQDEAHPIIGSGVGSDASAAETKAGEAK